MMKSKLAIYLGWLVVYICYQPILFFMALAAGFASDAHLNFWQSLLVAVIFYSAIYGFIPMALICLAIDYFKKTRLFVIVPNAILVVDVVLFGVLNAIGN